MTGPSVFAETRLAKVGVLPSGHDENTGFERGNQP